MSRTIAHSGAYARQTYLPDSTQKYSGLPLIIRPRAFPFSSREKTAKHNYQCLGACLQHFLDSTSESHGSDLIILSSWLGPLATGKFKDGGNEGSFEEHVMAAVSHS